MKSVWKQVLLGTAVALLTLQVQAQTSGETEKPEKKELPREIPSPDKEAKRETDRLKNALNLTDKQYKKVYKLVLKEQCERFEKRMGHSCLWEKVPKAVCVRHTKGECRYIKINTCTNRARHICPFPIESNCAACRSCNCFLYKSFF